MDILVRRRDCLAREHEKLLGLESAQNMLETTRYNFGVDSR